MPLIVAEDGIRIDCQEHVPADAGGDLRGTTLILIPDWLGSSRFYDDLVPCLTSRGARVITYDPRGSGRSDRPDYGYGLAREARDVSLILESLRITSSIVVGHGYGTLVGVQTALDAPHQVSLLVLLAPVPPMGLKRQGSVVKLWQESLEDWRRLTDLVASTSARTLNPERLSLVGKDMARTTHAAGRSQMSSLDLANLELKMRRISCPVRVVAGEYDDWVSPGRVRLQLLPYLERAQLDVIRETGHYLALEAPEEVADSIVLAVHQPDGPPPARPADLREEVSQSTTDSSDPGRAEPSLSEPEEGEAAADRSQDEGENPAPHQDMGDDADETGDAESRPPDAR